MSRSSSCSGRYIGFLPAHFAQQWVVQDLMRPLLEKRLGYQNPIYLTMRKTEQKKPLLSAFLDEVYAVHRVVPEIVKAKKLARV